MIKKNQFNVDESIMHNIGVYKVQLNNDIYIGYTTSGFVESFKIKISNIKDNDKKLSSVEQLLSDGAEFSILFDMNKNESDNIDKCRELLASKRDEYIIKYTDDGYNVVSKHNKNIKNKQENNNIINKKEKHNKENKKYTTVLISIDSTCVDKLMRLAKTLDDKSYLKIIK